MLGEVNTPVQGAGAALPSARVAVVGMAAGGAAGAGRFTGAHPPKSTNITNPMLDNRFICALLIRISDSELVG